MFIYKITVTPLGDQGVYIGMDTKDSKKRSRWRCHQRDYNKESDKRLYNKQLYQAMRKYGLENCQYEVLQDNIDNYLDLCMAESDYIKKFNSFKKGLNASEGGEGFGRTNMQHEEWLEIRSFLSSAFSRYNKEIKWANMDSAQRKEATAHLRTQEVYAKKAATLKEYYVNNPEAKRIKSINRKKYIEENREKAAEQSRINGLIGAKASSKSLTAIDQNGERHTFSSRSEFLRKTGIEAIYAYRRYWSRGESFRGWTYDGEPL